MSKGFFFSADEARKQILDEIYWNNENSSDDSISDENSFHDHYNSTTESYDSDDGFTNSSNLVSEFCPSHNVP